ncbi:MAG TPA: alpha/beta family hydrolase [Nitrospira sp.]|nr:alpha/beta family hydrolase [Nitrospira sp.]
MSLAEQALTLPVPEAGCAVAGVLLRPDEATWLLVLAHGAGAGMCHPFMEDLARELAACRVASLRYQFPFMEQRRKRPDPPAMLTATVRAAINGGREAAPDLPLLAGGKSLGGRMTALWLDDAPASQEAAGVRGLVFVGFPLHQPGRPAAQRGAHLSRVAVPMLFLQGTRDRLADLPLMRQLCATLGPLATLHVVETADHSFHVPKRAGKSDAAVLRELAGTVRAWADSAC